MARFQELRRHVTLYFIPCFYIKTVRVQEQKIINATPIINFYMKFIAKNLVSTEFSTKWETKTKLHNFLILIFFFVPSSQ